MLWSFGRLEGLKGTLSICGPNSFRACRHQENANKLFSPDLLVVTLSSVPWFVCRLWARRLIPLSHSVHFCKIRIMIVLWLSEGFMKLDVLLLSLKGSRHCRGSLSLATMITIVRKMEINCGAELLCDTAVSCQAVKMCKTSLYGPCLRCEPMAHRWEGRDG